MASTSGQERDRRRDKKLHLLVIAIVLLPLAASASPSLERVHIVSRVGDSATPDSSSKRALAEDGVTIFVLLEAKDGRRTRWFSEAPIVRIRGRTVRPEPLSTAPKHERRWWRVEPTTENMSNTSSGSFRFETIPYARTPIENTSGKGSIHADVRPTLTPDRGKGLGTMRYQLEVTLPGGKVLSTPGANSRRGRGSGGLATGVHRVSLRSADTYIGFLTEMYGQPYIWASAGMTNRKHQSERLEGSDCADFVTYGWRRMGHKVPYTWSEGLRKLTRRVSKGVPGEDGVYRDAKGNPLAFPKKGSLLLFPRHVGVVITDRGRLGVLDRADLMFHTLFKSPEIEEIGATSYAQSRVEVLHWRK